MVTERIQADLIPYNFMVYYTIYYTIVNSHNIDIVTLGLTRYHGTC